MLSRRAQRSPRALHSGYLAAARENLAPRLSRRALRLSRASQVISRPPQVISSRQVISRGLRISRALQAISSRLKLSRAARLSRAGPGCLEHLRSSRGRLELSREARLSRAGSGYLERSGYLEGSVEITRASRWLGPLRMTRSAQDDSVRYESSHVARHCKVRWPAAAPGYTRYTSLNRILSVRSAITSFSPQTCVPARAERARCLYYTQLDAKGMYDYITCIS